MTKNKKGFTIVEVVLVLAIAGLIFLMVFIALPALQRSQRNTQRKDDIARFITAITDYKSNNSNKSPFDSSTTINNLIDKYIKGTGGDAQWQDPDGTSYSFAKLGKTPKSGDKNVEAINPSGNALDNVNHKVYYQTNAGCGELENTYTYSAGKSDIALFYIAEGKQVICNDNH